MVSNGSSSNTATFSGLLSPSPAIATEKLLGSSNYLSWSKAVELWCIGQGLQDHLTTKLEDVQKEFRDNWMKADALLLSLLW